MAQISLPKLPVSEAEFVASLPWEGVLSLASHWAGAGSLFDWLGPGEWEIEREWSPDLVRARMASAILLHIEQQHLRYLPRHGGEWLDALSQQTHRLVRYSDIPTAHTDWATTLSLFGRYPSEAYVERKPVNTYDTSLTRVLKWTCTSILKAEKLVWAKFGRDVFKLSARRRFSSALELSEVNAAAVEERPSDFDLDACRQAGGVWLTLAKIASLVSALWSGSATAQLFALQPILPDFAHQLFELGVLGTLSSAVRAATADALWSTAAPLAAVSSGRPCLIAQWPDGRWNAYYQTVPKERRAASTPYLHLTKYLDGRPLRPDIWIEHLSGGERLELVFECKYSLDPRYVCSGVPQIFAYLVEFPPIAETKRIHIVVGPSEVVPSTRAWNGQFVLTNPIGAREIITRSFTSVAADLLSPWEVTT